MIERRAERARRRSASIRWLFAVLLLALVGCAKNGEDPAEPGRIDRSTADAPAPVRPPFLRVAGRGGATLLVLGTLHLGPESGWRFSPEIDREIDDATRFVLELDPDKLDEAQMGSLVTELAFLPPGTWLEDVISPDTAKHLAERDDELTAAGLPAHIRGRFEPWFLAVTLLELSARDTPYSLAHSADGQIAARRAGRGLIGLETADEQLRMLDAQPRSVQDAMLGDTLERLPNAAQELGSMVAAWRRADREVLALVARQGVEAYPALESFYEVLLDDRNRRWVEQLRPVLEDPAHADTKVFVAVGALHLIGPKGLERLFLDAGYEVTRIH